ncbi:MAG: hypothetical protein N2037_06520 [Acidimicrobiales bacterium]|nr:hypothetical protein [Acidimicrobiales bacterium]
MVLKRPPAKKGDGQGTNDGPRPARSAGTSTKVPEGGFQLDPETEAELVKFNAYFAAQQELEAHERRVRKAERAKDEAAARLREIVADPKATREQREEAERAYKEALAKLQAVRGGSDGASEQATSGADETVPGDGNAGTADAAGTEDGGAAVANDASVSPDGPVSSGVGSNAGDPGVSEDAVSGDDGGVGSSAGDHAVSEADDTRATEEQPVES